MNDREFSHARAAYERQQADMRCGLSPVFSPLGASYLPEMRRRAAGGEVEPIPEGPDYFAIARQEFLEALRNRPPRPWWKFWR